MLSPDGPDPVDAAGAIHELVQAARGAHAGQLAELVTGAAARLGLSDGRLWLVDIQQRWLVPYGPVGEGSEGDRLAVDGTLAGWAYRAGELRHGEAEGHEAAVAVWVPLVDGGERLGVLGGRLDAWTDDAMAGLTGLAETATRLLASDQRYSDRPIRARRLRPVSVAAEVQWSLLPPLSCVTPTIAVAGVLEPAYDIGGDSFDYAVSDTHVWLAVFDAMGHGLGATLMVAAAVGAYRQARRGGADLESCFRGIDQTVADQFGPDRFVTGVLAELDVGTGELSYLVAGHHPSVLLRSGRVVRHLQESIRLPFGLAGAAGPIHPRPAVAPTGSERLEPGDRVLLYTDGVVEARDAAGELFGLERLEDLLIREDASGSDVPETLRRLIHTVLDHQSHELHDDATLIMAQWR